MRIALTGATGLVGHPVAKHLSQAGYGILTLGRHPSPLGLPHRAWKLGETADLSGMDALIHAAFAHEPGKYRGGEGGEPETFLRLNRDGSLRLLESAGSMPIVFLSSRAVYGPSPAGTRLTENAEPRPDTLYGQMKRDVELAIAAIGGVSLRATGLYDVPPPGREHKWRELFRAYSSGRTVEPRVGTEVHCGDLADAIRLVLDGWSTWHRIFNVSDLVLDRRDLLIAYGRISGVRGPLPDRADAGSVNAMETGRLRELGWRPRGWDGLESTLSVLAKV